MVSERIAEEEERPGRRDDAAGPPFAGELSCGLVRGELHLQPPHRRVLQHGLQRPLPRHATIPHAPPQALRG